MSEFPYHDDRAYQTRCLARRCPHSSPAANGTAPSWDRNSYRMRTYETSSAIRDRNRRVRRLDAKSVAGVTPDNVSGDRKEYALSELSKVKVSIQSSQGIPDGGDSFAGMTNFVAGLHGPLRSVHPLFTVRHLNSIRKGHRAIPQHVFPGKLRFFRFRTADLSFGLANPACKPLRFKDYLCGSHRGGL